ncbi:hypothetical protein LTR53_016711 [Teratosphaeriaceae sp. CCFEE 6253]|nr:hypothetical protein LTR53_016711 [Teratosphaeriaceae sp. CCFEE 6253]
MRSKSAESRSIALRRLGVIYEALVINRHQSSKYYLVEGGEELPDMPPVQPMTVERKGLNFSPTTFQDFQRYVDMLGKDTTFDFSCLGEAGATTAKQAYPERHLRGEAGGDEPAEPMFEKRPSFFTHFLNLAAHPGFYGFRLRSAHEWADRFREQGLPELLWELRALDACGLQSLPNPFDSDWQVLYQVLKDSPVYTQAVVEIWAIYLHGQHKKTIVNYQSLRVGEWLQRILGFLGIGSLILTSDMTGNQRFAEVQRFNDGSDDVALLVPFTRRWRA